MSISLKDYNIKILNVNNLECIHNFTNINNYGYLNSACFLNDNKLYITTNNFNWNGNSEYIKLFDLNG